MAPITTTARTDKWTDYYVRNRGDGGPIQALFDANTKSLARKTEGNLNNVSKLTDFITGSSYGNMVLIPGRPGVMQLVHHGFACNTGEEFTLAFASRRWVPHRERCTLRSAPGPCHGNRKCPNSWLT